MKRRFESKWANLAAQAGVTLAAATLFLCIRPDIFAHARDTVEANYQQKVLTPKIIVEYLRTTPKPKIQIGAGPGNPSGWLNTGIEPTTGQAYLDATKPMPFPGESVDYIFGDHVIEHLDYDDALGFFKEAHRVLAPGGKLRMVTPNLNQFLALFNESDVEHSTKTSRYVADKLDSQKNWDKTIDPACLILNNEMHAFGHMFLYTLALPRESCRQAGFTGIRQYLAGESPDPTFTMVELRPRGEWKNVNAFEAMAIEATG